MLNLNNIVVNFGATSVLRGLTCSVQQGDFITVVGANGAGKSTLFDIISGKLQPNSGSITLEGHDITRLNEQQRAHNIARLFQKPALSTVSSLTVAQNLALATYKKRRVGLQSGMAGFPDRIVHDQLAEVGIDLSALLDRPMGMLSGGQQQLIAFVMAANIVPPKLLLLDEPTAALDPVSATKLLILAGQCIKKYGITTIMITHDPQIATSMGNKLWVLADGIVQRAYGIEKRLLSADNLVGTIDYEKLLNL